MLQAVTDVMKKSTVDKDEEEEEEEVGGIDIAAARERMLEEDKIDKQIYRERIKQKHRVIKTDRERIKQKWGFY